MNSADFAVALLSERDCSECMRCNGRWVPKNPTSEDLKKFVEKWYVCKIGFKKYETRNICNKFVDKRKVWSRVIFNLKYILMSLLIFDIIKYLGGVTKLTVASIIGDIIAVLINIIISYFINRGFLKKQVD